MKKPPIHRRLRVATEDLHQRVDQQAGDFDLATVRGQREFLTMMIGGLSAVEPALDRSGAEQVFSPWPSRRRLGAACEELGETTEVSHSDAIDYTDEAEIWGALYVLEGSRLGSRLLAKQAPGSQFLELSAEDRMWPAFLDALGAADERLRDPQGMIRGAEKTFAAFLR